MTVSHTAQDDRTYHTTQSAYVLPNDWLSAQEHRRLEATASHIRSLLDSKIVHAPLDPSAIHKVVDIGCGTGATTDELGLLFPAATVYGVDLSTVPALRPQRGNIEYIQGDILDLAAPGADERLAENSFDYLFSRFLMGGITDWHKYVDLCVKLAKPGAWIEMQEPDMARFSLPPSGDPYDVYPKRPSVDMLRSESASVGGEDPELWRVVWHSLMRSRGLEPRVGALLAKYFEDAGLHNVHVERYLLPFGTWGDMADVQRDMASIHEAFVRNDAPVLIRKLGSAGNMGSEEVDKVIEDLEGFVKRFQGNREFGWVYVVCGMKAQAP